MSPSPQHRSPAHYRAGAMLMLASLWCLLGVAVLHSGFSEHRMAVFAARQTLRAGLSTVRAVCHTLCILTNNILTHFTYSLGYWLGRCVADREICLPDVNCVFRSAVCWSSGSINPGAVLQCWSYRNIGFVLERGRSRQWSQVHVNSPAKQCNPLQF